MKRYDLIVVGAGPAGMSAAIEAARLGAHVVVFDENAQPGGQLFKQIHKFFGSKEHKAKVRGFRIGRELLEEAGRLGVTVELDATVIGLYQDKEVVVRQGDEVRHYKGDAVVVATGAAENMVGFDGWTLPGVIGAGAAQTMMNLHGIRPGQRVLMLGSGNVGLVVSYQLLQAGCEVVAVVDAAPRVGGYGVHAAKVARTGVPFYLSHTIVRAEGDDHVTGVTIAQVDEHFQFVPGTEKHFDVDTVCVAVGLSPMSQLFKMDGCDVVDDPKRGGQVPVVDEQGETSIPGIYAAGDVSGIEEASSAMIEGRIAGLSAAAYLGYLEQDELVAKVGENERALDGLRQGMFAPGNRGKKIELTEEGIPVSESLLSHGYVADDEIVRFPGFTHRAGIHPVIECTQNIPCNPCQDVCPKHCIKVGEHITQLPAIEPDSTCIGCGMCVAACPGQAIFLVDEHADEEYADVTFPFEFTDVPAQGDTGRALGRDGAPLCEAEVVGVKSAKAFDSTRLVTMRVPQAYADRTRFFKSGAAASTAAGMAAGTAERVQKGC